MENYLEKLNRLNFNAETKTGFTNGETELIIKFSMNNSSTDQAVKISTMLKKDGVTFYQWDLTFFEESNLFRNWYFQKQTEIYKKKIKENDIKRNKLTQEFLYLLEKNR